MAKEAAARVMAQEKSAGFAFHERGSIQFTTEAESLSQNQQRRIDELEAQLNEAEGLIIDLRAELHDVHEQLNEVKNKHFHYLRPHGKEDLVCRNSIMGKSKLNTSESLKFPTELGSKVCKSANMSDIALCNYLKDNLNETEIYQNGWCAIEMSLEDERSHSGDDPCFPVKVTQVTEPSGPDAEARIQPSSKAKKVEDLVGEEPLKGKASKQRPYTFRGQRRRKARYGKTKTSSCLLPVRRRSIRKRRVNYLAVVLHFECTVKSTILGGEGGIEEGTGFQAASSDLTAENKICRKFASADNDDKELIDVSLMVEEVESVLGDAKASEGSKESPLLKYTFSRKRKKDNLLNPNENSSLESAMKKRSSEIENIDPRLQDSESLKDLPLKSKQLVQVARQDQLIEMQSEFWREVFSAADNSSS
ncbi:hypothetical protein RND71_032691 [Anisodus tanguticus]|uniref:Uncharacterized protein n=1 Tax=Anisodus tanguticus TaxID=243964 RepID=A0AAE1R9P5_9SOLA|nr:hypothetical protein RND71_032691 [Anisodus tanguticus]